MQKRYSTNLDSVDAYTVYVEGEKDDSFDKHVVSEILSESNLDVRTMGNCTNLYSASQAFVEGNKKYLCIIDGDYWDKKFIDSSWNNFESNDGKIIIWRKRQLENYFIDPELFLQSTYINSSKADLERKIIVESEKIVFRDIINFVISNYRNKCRFDIPISNIHDPSDIQTKESALNKLLTYNILQKYKRSVQNLSTRKELERSFNKYYKMFFGNNDSLGLLIKTWLDKIDGKIILESIIRDCCDFSSENYNLNIRDKKRRFCKDILSKIKGTNKEPEDFKSLRDLIGKRVSQ